jgi:hypothetical protein
MSVSLPPTEEFDITIVSNKLLVSSILHYSSNYLVEYIETKRVEHIHTEDWSKEEGKWILRRHITLDSISVDPYHYFAFIVHGEKDTNFKLQVISTEVSYEIKK